MPEPLRFDEHYEETIALRSGEQVRLRLVRPEDKEALLAAFQRLSPVSRFRRFMMARSTLTPAELRYLTEVDHWNHLAIVAIAVATGDGLGIARFIRLAGQPRVAEPAVTVLDRAQSQGLGRLLLERLATAARERGIDRFHCEMLVANEPVRCLLHHLVPDADESSDGDVMVVEGVLPEALPGRRTPRLYADLGRLMARALDRMVLVRRALRGH